MAWFLVETRYVPEKVGEVRPRHREYLTRLAADGVCKIAGPLADGTGGAMILEVADEQELTRLLDADPYHAEGALAARTVREFNPVIGSWLAAT